MYHAFSANLSYRWTALVLVEHLLIVTAVGVAAMAPSGFQYSTYDFADFLWRAMLIAFVLQFCLHYCDMYDLRTLSDRHDLLIGLLRALGAASLILALLYFWQPGLIIGRGVFIVSSILIIALVAGW